MLNILKEPRHPIGQILFDFILTVQLKIKSVKEEIAVVSRKIYLTQDEASSKKARCEELDRGTRKCLLMFYTSPTFECVSTF